jgi:hypothetical protein
MKPIVEDGEARRPAVKGQPPVTAKRGELRSTTTDARGGLPSDVEIVSGSWEQTLIDRLK